MPRRLPAISGRAALHQVPALKSVVPIRYVGNKPGSAFSSTGETSLVGEGRGGEEVVAQPLSKAVTTKSRFVRWIIGMV